MWFEVLIIQSNSEVKPKFFQSALILLSRSSVVVAISAGLATAQTYLIFNKDINWIFASTVGLASFGVYNLQQLAISLRNSTRENALVNWIRLHQKKLIGLSLLSLMASGLLILPYLLFVWPVLFLSGLIAFLYALPPNKGIGLRNFPFAKTFVVGFTWALLNVAFPLMEINVSLKDGLLLFSQQVLLITALTIPFDIRDLEDDEYAKIQTFPGRFGPKNALVICQVLLILSWICGALILSERGHSQYYFLGWSVGLALMSILLVFARLNSSEFYYSILIDGSISLQLILTFMTAHAF